MKLILRKKNLKTVREVTKNAILMCCNKLRCLDIDRKLMRCVQTPVQAAPVVLCLAYSYRWLFSFTIKGGLQAHLFLLWQACKHGGAVGQRFDRILHLGRFRERWVWICRSMAQTWCNWSCVFHRIEFYNPLLMFQTQVWFEIISLFWVLTTSHSTYNVSFWYTLNSCIIY